MRNVRMELWIAILVGVTATVAWATEPVKIASLLNDPKGYNMRLVQVDGEVTAHQMNHFIGSVSKLEKCVQRFLVKDDTGSIEAVYTTLCQKGTPLLESGDHVTMEAHFSGVLEVRSLTKK